MSDARVLSSPVAPLPAASLILLRQADGLEVLVGRRSLSARAFPGATAFPGGKLEAQDAAWPGARGHPLHVHAYAALRETFEETGLLLAAGGEGPPPGADVAAARHAVESGAVSFVAQLAAWDRRLDLGRLVPFARWITPAAAPYRFDTVFFVVEASPDEAQASLICAEFETLRWTRPDQLLDDDGLRLMTPTRHGLQALSGAVSAMAAVAEARARGMIDGEAVRAAGRL